MIHERIVELITQVHRKVFDKTEPGKIVDLFKLGTGTPPALGIAVSEVVAGFYSFLGFPRLMTTAAIRRGIAKGVTEGHFGYVTGPQPDLGPDGKFKVASDKVRVRVVLPEEELDLESGFLMLPQSIPQPAASVGPQSSVVAPGGELGQLGAGGELVLPGGTPSSGPVTTGGFAAEKPVELTFMADRNQLFTAWNAIANLADLAGKVRVTVRAESEKGFDKSKLQNGVLEPLREADLIE
jgi:hypothetical protein